MKRILAVFAVLNVLFLFVAHAPAMAGNKEIVKVQDATQILNEIMAIPEQSIPPALLSNAYGIAIIPNLIKASFLVGARYGSGVLLVHNLDRTWSNPVFITVAGGSFGFQAGAQSTDVILVFKSSRSVSAITGGKFTLGADASVAAGPVGRHAEASTDLFLQSEIVSYARSRGLFAGVALEGAALQVDYYASSVFYNTAGLLPTQILTDRNLQAPLAAGDLRNALARYANQ